MTNRCPICQTEATPDNMTTDGKWIRVCYQCHACGQEWIAGHPLRRAADVMKDEKP